MNKEEKKQVVEDVVEIFSKSGFYLLDFKGFNVAEITELRNKLRDADVSMRVVKNTLAKRALEEVNSDESVRESFEKYFKGPTGLVWSKEDPIAPVRVLVDFLGDKKFGTIKAGMLDGMIVQEYDIEKISKLPSKQVLYAQVASALNAPIVKLARVLKAVPENFVRTLDAVREKKESDAA
ncbi:50S ribosomal protein L10 [Candidatus Latescibacterota bacterium]